MKRKLIKRNKSKLSLLLKLARQEDDSLAMYIDLFKRLAASRAALREEQRYGTTKDWGNAENRIIGLAVPNVSNKSGKTLNFTVYTALDQLPADKQDFFRHVFENTYKFE